MKAETERILKLIPGYDPFVNSDGYVFDEKKATMMVEFFEECLTHVKGDWAGKAFILEDWQKSILMNLFGWQTKGRKRKRRYREAFIFVPRKNGKSIMAAGICVAMLCCDGEQGAEIYSAAADRDQAAIVWGIARRMIMNSPDLSKACRLFQHSIVIEEIGSFYKAISAEAHTAHGFNTHCAVVDELHAQRDGELVDVLTTSTGARRQPLIVYITTSDYERKSVCNTKYDYAVKVRDGIIKDPCFLPVIYEAKLTDNWRSPEVWKKANPNLGVSFQREYLERECMRAQESPAYENTFKRLHLNIRTEQITRWLSMEKWNACPAVLDTETLKGEECWAGLDLASTQDIAAFVLYFPEVKACLCRFWVPKDGAIKRERRDRVPYLQWANEGYLKLTEGNVTDYDTIRADINELNKDYYIQEIAIDRWNATQLTTQLVGDGFNVIGFGQGFASMSAPSKELEKLVISEEINHGGNPVLNWMASNVSAGTDPAGNIKPLRDKSNEKIDGIVALVMALGRAMIRPVDGDSVYDKGESIFL